MLHTLLAADDARNARTARFLHDHAAQSVAALLLGLGGLERELAKGTNPKPTLESLQAIAQSLGEDLAKLALDLRPATLEDRLFIPSLETFFEEWSALQQAEVEFDYIISGYSRFVYRALSRRGGLPSQLGASTSGRDCRRRR